MMRKLLLILIFSFSTVFSQEFVTKHQFDSLFTHFVREAKEIYIKSNIRKKIIRDPYESTADYQKRLKRRELETEKIVDENMETYYSENSKEYTVTIDVDSVKYNADTEKAKIFFDKIKIPNRLGFPMVTAYVFPVFTYPEKWKVKEGFGLVMQEIPIKREYAKENDILKNKGNLEFKFKFKHDQYTPVIELIGSKWLYNDKYLWAWKGKCKIPVSKLRGILKGNLE